MTAASNFLTREEIFTFWQGPLSNWHMRSFRVQGVTYNCVEQWMMASKARTFGDQAALDKIMAAASPKDQKAAGRAVQGYDDNIWQALNDDLVLVGGLGKFTQHEDLFRYLMDTGNRLLIEASPHDKIWGVGLAESDDRILDRSKWLGSNKQGKMLTRVRNLLRQAASLESRR